MAIGMLLSAKAQAVQCVTYAREESGLALKGDAWTWWNSSTGQYEHGQKPRAGAVVVFKKHGSMSHGHVAVIAEVVNARKVLVDHANWAPHRGRGRGEVSTRVMMMDVSPHNDWTQVRVWNETSSEMGQRVYPTYGFIYAKAGRAGAKQAPDIQEAAAKSSAPAADPEIELAFETALDAALPGARAALTPLAAASLLPSDTNFAQ